MCVSWRISLCYIVRLYPEFGWYAYGTCSGVNCLWVQVRVGVQIQVHVGVLRVCLFVPIMVRFSEVPFRFRDL